MEVNMQNSGLQLCGTSYDSNQQISAPFLDVQTRTYEGEDAVGIPRLQLQASRAGQWCGRRTVTAGAGRLMELLLAGLSGHLCPHGIVQIVIENAADTTRLAAAVKGNSATNSNRRIACG